MTPQALSVAEEQQKLLREAYGNHHHEYATAMNNVATLYQATPPTPHPNPLQILAVYELVAVLCRSCCARFDSVGTTTVPLFVLHRSVALVLLHRNKSM